MDSLPSRRVVELVSELTDGRLSADARDELRRLLAADPVALDWYCQWMALHADLHWDLGAGQAAWSSVPLLGQAARGPSSSPRRRARWSRGVGLGLAAALLVGIAVGRWRSAEPRPAASPTAESRRIAASAAGQSRHVAVGRPIALLSYVTGDAASSTDALRPGATLDAGPFRLEAGLVQLEMLSGANLIVEGPAEIELVSSMLVKCQRGKLRAHVPGPAQGFTIETPQHRAVDLGTEFAIDVDASRATEVHVLDGEVQFDAKQGAPQNLRLALGEGYRASAEGGGKTIVADGGRFVDARELIRLAARESDARQRLWETHARTLAADRDVIAYFDFEGHAAWQRTLRQAATLRTDVPDGAIVGCRWTAGRWPTKQALEFRGTEDRIRVTIPGEFASVTLACWLRVQGFDRWLSSLLLTDGHDLGEVHWQFTESGQLLLGVKAEPDQSHDYLSPEVLRLSDTGRWVHVACVYDRSAGEVRHFVDGRRVSAEAIRRHVPLRFGPSELGNWAAEDFIDHRIRSLNGSLDEFVVWGKPLDDAAIAAMYRVGAPPSP